MRLARVQFDGFRNLQGSVELSHPLSVIVGANNTGKSSVVDALRMLLFPLVGWPPRIRRDDFAHGGTGEPVVERFQIGATFEGLSLQQRGRLITALDAAPGQASLHIEAELTSVGPPRARLLGGEAKSPDIEDWARNAVTYTYLPPLRDAEEDLRPGRGSRLVELVGALAEEHDDRSKICEIAAEANTNLSTVDAITESLTRIQNRLNAVSGEAHAQNAALLFTEPTFERVLASLGIRLGDAAPLPLHHNGLGMNNILYMAVLLAALSQNHDSELHIILVEEPEAHLHPQMQDLLMRFLQREVEGREDLQIVVTTHSPNLASAARVERVTSMVAMPDGIRSAAIGNLGLLEEELDHLARFLDVTKASLLFGRAVILVEGVAEQLVLPLLSEELGVSLSEESVALINVGGLAFGPFAALFSETRLPNRCAILSDSDPPASKDDPPVATGEGDGDNVNDLPAAANEQNDNPDPGGDGLTPPPDPVLSATAEKLVASENQCRHVFLSEKTFEHDLVVAGNWSWTLRALGLIKPRVAKRLANDATLDTETKRADAMLAAVDGVKGRFAQALTRTVQEAKDAGDPIVVPDYIRKAILWACNLPDPNDVEPPPAALADADVPL